MKAHVGVDVNSGLVRTVTATAAMRRGQSLVVWAIREGRHAPTRSTGS